MKKGRMCGPLQPPCCPVVRRDGLRNRAADRLASVLVGSVLHLLGSTHRYLGSVEPIVIDVRIPT